MATIGKDGKDGSDGSEGSALLAMLESDADAVPLPVNKLMFRVDLKGIAGVDAGTQGKSDDFWETARGMGLLSASVTRSNGDTTLFIPASDENEVEQLISSDPILKAECISSKKITRIG